MMLTLSLAGAGAGDSEGFAPDVAALTGVLTDSDAMLAYQHRGRKATFGVSWTRRPALRLAQAGSITPMREQGDVRLLGWRRHAPAPRQSERRLLAVLSSSARCRTKRRRALDESALAHGDYANSDLGALTYTTDAGDDAADRPPLDAGP